MLTNDTAAALYHDHAEKMPIYDYHCHIPPSQIAEDIRFENLTAIWLYGDHYKWRAMRTYGVKENYCTGNAGDYEKFEKWVQTAANAYRNPLYHWSHLELKRYFGIDKLLTPDNAREIYDRCTEMLQSDQFSCRNLMRKMNVKLVCTTDDPLDDLSDHKKIREDGFEIAVHPAWRPDKAIACQDIQALNIWIDSLEEITSAKVKDFDSYLDAIKARHDFFHDNGCRLSDHGLETAYAQDYTPAEINKIFKKIRSNTELTTEQCGKFKSAMLHELAVMDCEKNWVQQFHFGALRNNNTKMLKQLGPDTGFDSIGDFVLAKPLAKFLDTLDSQNKLAKTILYNLNPRDNALMATMIGNFQDGSCKGKMQWGSGWWFLDQEHGMRNQLNTLSVLGMLSTFVGMLTDSRSFLSYPRHEYFRRILCDLLGSDIESERLPDELENIGKMVQNISYKNAVEYFPMKLNQ
jgi:glucuronate isomerase